MVRRIISRVIGLAIALSVAGVLAGSQAFGAADLRAETEPTPKTVDSAFDIEDVVPAATISVNDFDYDLSDTTCTLIRYKGTAATIVLPKTAVIEGKTYNVTLGTNQDGMFQTTKSAFYESNAKSVSFEEGFAFPVDSSNLFNSCGLDELDLTGVDFSKVENMTSMFSSCFFPVSLRGMDTSHVTNMNSAFDGAHEVDLYGIDTSHVTDVRYMFRSNRADVIDLSSLNFSSVKSCYGMFYHCQATKVYFGATYMSNCGSYKNMFYECSNLETVDLCNVKVNLPRDEEHMVNMQDMFYKCTKLKKIDMAQFSCYADVQYLCYECKSLEYLDVSSMYAFGPESSGIYGIDKLQLFRPFTRANYSYRLAVEMVDKDGMLWSELPEGDRPVTELVAVKITKQPSGKMAVENTEVTFAIETNISDKETYENAFYRWQYSADDGVTWTDLRAYGKTYTFTAEMSMDNYAYRCLVNYKTKTTPSGNKADMISKAAWLLVWEESVTIESHPVSRSGFYGDPVSFRVDASGNLLKYCWQESTDNGKTWKNSSFSGADTYTLRLSCTPSVDGRLFRCIVSSGNLEKYTDIVKLESRSLISEEPSDQTVDAGEKAVFKVTSDAAGVTYQWMFSSDGGKTWQQSTATGNKTKTLKVDASIRNNRYLYYCEVTNGAYCQHSKEATLILNGVTPTPKVPTKVPTKRPTKTPTKVPTKVPTDTPTKGPTKTPTKVPTKVPTDTPTKVPTKVPTKTPTSGPTKAPTKTPTNGPTKAPTKVPTPKPGEPTVTPIPGTPTVTPVPGDPTVTPVPGTPTPEPTPAPVFSDFVERLYTCALNRASEPGGKKFWTDEVTSGRRTGGDCARYFLLEAPEFMNRNLSVEEFVETLYMTFFDRASDAEGKQGWVNAIETGKMTREVVVENFIESTEWCNICAKYSVKSGAKYHKATIASPNAIAFATRLYTCCLGRDAEEGGLNYWSLALTNLEQTGCSAAKEFFTSKEFVNFNLKDDEYVRRLYTTFMDREPEASEVDYWTGEIAGGRQTRDSVLAFFGQSEEFTNICKKYGIDRGTI